MFVVDTNVLVYAADADSTPHARCRDLLGEWRSGASAWYTTWPALYEFLRWKVRDRGPRFHLLDSPAKMPVTPGVNMRGSGAYLRMSGIFISRNRPRSSSSL